MKHRRRKDEAGAMNDNSRANGSRSTDPYRKLRLAGLIAAIAGVTLLAALAFVLSYGGIHALARQAGMSASMARLFPLIFDAMLVVSGVAVLLLRGAGWWRRGYAWLIMMVLLVAVAAGDAVHAAGTHLPRRPAAIIAAVLPWALLLLAFSLVLTMLRQFRYRRAAMTGQQAAVKLEAARPVVRSAAHTAGRTGLDDLLNRGRAAAPAIVSKTAADATQPVGAVATARTENGHRPAQAKTAAPHKGAAGAEPPDSTRPTITQPIAPTVAAKPAATALDAADQPATSQDQPADQAPGTKTPADDPKPIAQPPADETPADDRPADDTAADETPTDETPTDETPAEETPADETPADETPPEPAGPVNGAIRVPQQPMRAPVPGPSPHFDRLRRTPPPPDEDNDTDS
jgi:uncharacterized membrane protein SirB2